MAQNIWKHRNPNLDRRTLEAIHVCCSFVLQVRNLTPKEAVTHLQRLLVTLEPEPQAGVLSPVTAAARGVIKMWDSSVNSDNLSYPLYDLGKGG